MRRKSQEDGPQRRPDGAAGVGCHRGHPGSGQLLPLFSTYWELSTCLVGCDVRGILITYENTHCALCLGQGGPSKLYESESEKNTTVESEGAASRLCNCLRNGEELEELLWPPQFYRRALCAFCCEMRPRPITEEAEDGWQRTGGRGRVAEEGQGDGLGTVNQNWIQCNHSKMKELG